jgi:hypothetical protein
MRPLVREGAGIGQDRSCQTVNKHLVMSRRWGSIPRHTDRPTVSRKVTLTLTVYVVVVSFIVVFCVLCFCLNVLLISVMCVTCLLCPISVLLPPGENPIAV